MINNITYPPQKLFDNQVRQNGMKLHVPVPFIWRYLVASENGNFLYPGQLVIPEFFSNPHICTHGLLLKEEWYDFISLSQ